MPCPVSPPALWSLGRGEPPTFTVHLAADEFKAQGAGAAAHHGVDADELGSDGGVEHVGLHGAVVHVPLENLQRRAGLSAPAPPAASCIKPLSLQQCSPNCDQQRGASLFLTQYIQTGHVFMHFLHRCRNKRNFSFFLKQGRYSQSFPGCSKNKHKALAIETESGKRCPR